MSEIPYAELIYDAKKETRINNKNYIGILFISKQDYWIAKKFIGFCLDNFSGTSFLQNSRIIQFSSGGKIFIKLYSDVDCYSSLIGINANVVYVGDPYSLENSEKLRYIIKYAYSKNIIDLYYDKGR